MFYFNEDELYSLDITSQSEFDVVFDNNDIDDEYRDERDDYERLADRFGLS